MAPIKRKINTEHLAILKYITVKIDSHEFVVHNFDMHLISSQISETTIILSCDKKIKTTDLLHKKAKINIVYKQNKQTYHGLVYTVVDCNLYKPSDNKDNIQIKHIIIKDYMVMLLNNTQSRVFGAESISNIIKEIFKPYDFKVNVKIKVNDKKIMCQFNESDYVFFTRICAEYHIGYYFDHSKNEYIIHDQMSSTGNINLDKLVYKENSIIHSANQMKAEISSRTQWSTNIVTQNFAQKTHNYLYSYYLQGYNDEGNLKTMSENYVKSKNMTLIYFYNIEFLVFPGCQVNKLIVIDVIVQFQNNLEVDIICIDSGVKIVEFQEYRGHVMLNGFVQAKADSVTENQNTINTKVFELPVRLSFEKKNLVYARQSTPWFGKFYGFYFPIRENTEVLLLFHDSLLSSCSIINCYFNNADSVIFEENEVGIKTSTLTTTSSETPMNQISFLDKKDKELVSLIGKKDMKVNTKEKMDFSSEKTIDMKTETMTIETEKTVDIKAKEKIVLEAKEVNIEGKDSHEQKTDKDYKITAGGALELSGQKCKMESKSDILIKGQKLVLDAQNIEIKSKMFKLTGTNIEIEGKMTKITSKMFTLELNLFQLKTKLSMLESKLFKLTADMQMVEAKMIMLKGTVMVT